MKLQYSQLLRSYINFELTSIQHIQFNFNLFQKFVSSGQSMRNFVIERFTVIIQFSLSKNKNKFPVHTINTIGVSIISGRIL